MLGEHDAKAADSLGTGAAPSLVTKPWEAMGGDEKHNLQYSNKAAYEATKADWVKRGSPARAAK
mgnify:CR=1 FL=1